MIIKTTLKDYLNNPNKYEKEFLDIDYIRIDSCNRKIRSYISKDDITSRKDNVVFIRAYLIDTREETEIPLDAVIRIYYKSDGTFKTPAESYPYYESESLAYKMRDYEFKSQ